MERLFYRRWPETSESRPRRAIVDTDWPDSEWPLPVLPNLRSTNAESEWPIRRCISTRKQHFFVCSPDSNWALALLVPPCHQSFKSNSMQLSSHHFAPRSKPLLEQHLATVTPGHLPKVHQHRAGHLSPLPVLPVICPTPSLSWTRTNHLRSSSAAVDAHCYPTLHSTCPPNRPPIISLATDHADLRSTPWFVEAPNTN